HEFIFEPGRSLESTVEEMLQLLVRWGLVVRDGDDVVPVPTGVRMGQLLSDLLRPFLEAMWVAVDALELLLAAPMPTREWSRQALDRGRAAWLAGRVRRIESLSRPRWKTRSPCCASARSCAAPASSSRLSS